MWPSPEGFAFKPNDYPRRPVRRGPFQPGPIELTLTTYVAKRLLAAIPVLFGLSVIVFLIMATDFAWLAWVRGERGMDTAWMPHMGPIKTVLPVGIVLLLIQGVSELLKSIYAATRGRWPT